MPGEPEPREESPSTEPTEPGDGTTPSETAAWEQELADGLAGIESSSLAPPEGLQPRRVIVTSQNGSSLTFVRRRGAQSVPKS